MSRNGIWLVPIALIAIAVATMDVRSARASRTPVQPNNGCASSGPCLKWVNNGSGDGIDGTSSAGVGAIGVTSAQGTSSSTAGDGVKGTDSGTGTFNNAVKGTSSKGTGVMGTSANGVGVSAHAGSSGIAAFGIDVNNGSIGALGAGLTGARGQADGQPLEGVNTSDASSDAILINTKFKNAIAIAAHNFANTLVFSIGNQGQFAANSLTVDGPMGSTSRVVVGATAAIAVYGQGTSLGVSANLNHTVSNSGSMFAENVPGANLFRGNNSQGNDVFIVDDRGNVQAHALISGFSIGRQATARRTDVATYGVQNGDETLEDGGMGRLSAGHDRVRFDRGLIAALDGSAAYVVFVTPEGACRPLYATDRTAEGFDVVESGGGHCSAAFSYRIEARPGSAAQPRFGVMRGPWMPKGHTIPVKGIPR